MKIAFDHQIFIMQKYGGVSRYFCSLARELNRMDGIFPEIHAPLHCNQYLSELADEVHRGLQVPFDQAVFHRNAGTSRRMARYSGINMARYVMSQSRPDIFHETYYEEESICPPGARRVLTVYDMIHEMYPEVFPDSEETIRAKRIAIERADHILCISENTRKDLVSWFDLPIEKTSVTYLGVEDVFFGQEESAGPVHGKPFLLYVGSRFGYKNFGRFVRAFASSAALRTRCDIICFGGGALQPYELSLIADAGLPAGQIVQLGGDDDVLASLYRQADALIYPSVYEGFGIPPLEAMASGCPVVCSNSSSLPEVAGDAAEYFNPLDERDMQAAMERIVGSATRRKELVALGRIQSRKFTWQKCAEETAAAYRQLLSGLPA